MTTYGNRDIQRQLNRIERTVNDIKSALPTLASMEFTQMIDTKELVREVRETKDAVQASKIAFQAHLDALQNIQTDDPEVQKQIDDSVKELQGIQDELAQAVPAGTPAAPDAGVSTGGVPG